MNKITIEFFHDVICSFCFPMSYRMRKLFELMPEVEIVHRSFALVKTEADFDAMFGSRAKAKDEILTHWSQANFNDDLHRFNIAGMKKADFPFPTSMKGLLACKAGGLTAGQGGYWDVFDAIQNALFVENRNVEDQSVIDDCVRASGIDFDTWQRHYQSQETLDAVENDLQLVKEYQITSVPTLVINGKHRINGAQPLSRLVKAVQDVAAEDK